MTDQERIAELEAKVKQLESQLIDANREAEQLKNAAVSKITKRVSHEVDKLDKCFTDDTEKSLIGRRILNKIREAINP